MGKKKSGSTHRERDDLSSLLAPPKPMRPVTVRIPLQKQWPEISDRRLAQPQLNPTSGRLKQPPRSFKGIPVNVSRSIQSTIKQPNILSTVRSQYRLPSRSTQSLTRPEPLAFNMPSGVVMCARRQVRKEVLFAKRKTAKGSRSKKHRNQWSDVKC